MDIERYKVFIKVAELQSITKTAEQFGYTQSGVSHIINALEGELGFPVFLRTRNGVMLTSEGERLLPFIRELLKSNEHLEQEVGSLRGVETGNLRIGTISSVAIHWLPRLIKGFSKEHPGIGITIKDGVYNEVEDWIGDGTVDCGFLSQFSVKRRLDIMPIYEDRVLVVLPSDYPLAEESFFSLDILDKEPFILPGEGYNYDIGRIFESIGKKAKIQFAVRDDYSALAMVEQGLGITILPELILRGTDKKIKALELEGKSRRTIALAAVSFKKASPALRSFAEYVRQTCTGSFFEE